MPERAEVEHLLLSLDHLRAAHRALGTMRPAPAQLRAMVSRELARGEAAAGEALHTLVADGGGGVPESLVKKAAETLGNAQALFEEAGDAASAQRMMRRQGSLQLAAALYEEIEGAGHERAASSRET